MVRRACFPVAGYPDLDFPSWQDDDMALTIGRFFPVLHCGLPVAVMYPGTERITSNWERLAKGCKLMVRKYRKDIVRYHGYSRLVLWWLRILRACLLSYQEGCKETNLYSRNGIRKYTPFHLGSVGRHHVLSLAVMILDWALRDKFEYIFA
ncbi:MAG: hypothetical protein ABIN58_13475, partial [candidate division WOR-3 bacterium]